MMQGVEDKVKQFQSTAVLGRNSLIQRNRCNSQIWYSREFLSNTRGRYMHVMIGTNDEGNLRRKVRKGTYEDRG